MKIRKTTLRGNPIDVFIYENKKDEYFVMAIPELEWSIHFSYDEEDEDLKERLIASLDQKAAAGTDAVDLGRRLLQWAKEM
ncbi:YueH family protein [Heyndrickxia acidicola]|uniref:YueH family protein n=1 Tax=Heyndrickxia acidicola TaxID=209389 RepID=A0ABU6MM57_9BACI|nr:YueH family protein [Heyndrickxia acidicola]MED1204302.1 YueH family protein [Heyndrickxia acidicola]